MVASNPDGKKPPWFVIVGALGLFSVSSAVIGFGCVPLSKSTPFGQYVDSGMQVAFGPDSKQGRLSEGDVLFERALRLKAEGDFKGFFEAMAEAQRKEPLNCIYVYAVADAYRELGNKGLAFKRALTAARLAVGQGMYPPNAVFATWYAASRAEAVGRYDVAEKLLERALALYWAHQDQLILYARAESRYGFWKTFPIDANRQLSGAQKRLRSSRPIPGWVEREAPWMKDALQPLVSQAIRNQAEVQLRKLEALDRTNWSNSKKKVISIPANVTLADDYFALGRNEEAIVHYLADTLQEPGDSYPWDKLGWLFLREYRFSDAAYAFEKACDFGFAEDCPRAQRCKCVADRWRHDRGGK